MRLQKYDNFRFGFRLENVKVRPSLYEKYYLCILIKMKRIILVSVLLFSLSGAIAQRSFDFRFWEDSLIHLRNSVVSASSEIERYQLNEDFMNLLESILWEPNSFKFGWDSVKNFSVVTSPDKLFKIFTWFVPKDDFTYENFGFLQVYNDRRKKYVIYPLYDKRGTIDYPNTHIGDQNHWYGAIYYKVVPLEAKNKTYYTLFGWNGNNLFTNQKIIEVLHFKADQTPMFGAMIFKKYSSKVSRVILEYAKNSVLSLKYERQAYELNTGKKDPKTRKPIYETVWDNLIIFDVLAPLEDGLDGIPAYLVPESSLNQGFVADNGKWLYLPKVKGYNPDVKRPEHEIKQREFYKPPK